MIILLCALLPMTAAASASFFLLSDASYGTDDEARVRLEVSDRSAVYDYGGVDIAVYRVQEPLKFLASQQNLHRIQVQPQPSDGGLWNILSHFWDSLAQEARRVWRQHFSTVARQQVVKKNPDLMTRPDWRVRTPAQQPRRFARLPGFDLVSVFRYPVQFAKAIQPPAGVAMEGSSSDFIEAPQGNVYVPLGRLQPGLYVVEAASGTERALTALFVSDTIVVTKTSAAQLLAWTVNRKQGTPVKGAESWWTDGRGVLARGNSDTLGLTEFSRPSPERSFVYGIDPKGGVFISENYYYDSEIYNTKVYAVTERPLYRPGDNVYVKILAREFRNARESKSVASMPVTVQVFDPNGLPVAKQQVQLASDTGGNTSFRLPENSPAGGYELRIIRGKDSYTAAFRVSEYQKPHFEISLKLDKPSWKTGEVVKGRLQLRYPDGKPVRKAQVDLVLRSQQMTIVEGDLRYMGQFPVKLNAETLHTDADGDAILTLPAANKPSRYVLSALATDGAAYRVRSTQEILIERSASTWHLQAERQFSDPGKDVVFALSADANGGAQPVSWEWIRLEDRARQSGAVADINRLRLNFPQSGSYSIALKDVAGNMLGATQHWVSGNGVAVAAGNIEIVFDKPSYVAGDSATALISFPEAAQNVLLTLERDKVERTALLADGDSWVKTKQIAKRQWQISLPVQELFSPNITFSVAYVKDNHFVFQNQGILVEQPSIKLQFKPEREVYRPGDKVNIDISATLNGKPVATPLSVGVVDEMIYVLQPEIAPNIREFFYHPRRNNVRTTASFSFIGYDVSTSHLGVMPARSQANERAIKVLERPRRDNVDTVYWNPRIVTGTDGRIRISFVMPDALTRWRITARAMSPSGAVGQGTAYVRSEKPYYLKWTSPDWLRQGDHPIASVAVFNQGDRTVSAELVASQALTLRKRLILKPGINFESVPLDDYKGGNIQLSLQSNGSILDSLAVGLRAQGLNWRSPQVKWLTLSGQNTALALPADAYNVRVSLAPTVTEHFARVVNDLMEYPYGCIEQTASRMIPLTLAFRVMQTSDDARAMEISRQLYAHRLRLSHMASPEGRFGWWGRDMTTDPFLTGWAYYADWQAAQALGLVLPPEHWQTLLSVYRDGTEQMSPWQRALMVDWMRQMQLPVATLVAGVLNDLQRSAPGPEVSRQANSYSSLLDAEDSSLDQTMAYVLVGYMAEKAKVTIPPAMQRRIASSRQQLAAQTSPLAAALRVYVKQAPSSQLATLLPTISQDYPTMDRALMLTWLAEAMGGYGKGKEIAQLGTPWQKVSSLAGGSYYRLTPGQYHPSSLMLKAAPPRPIAALVSYESADVPNSKPLPLQLKRDLYRLVPAAGGGFLLLPVQDGDALHTDALYLDEIRLSPNGGGRPLHYGLVEVPLPPGAALETGTWGVNLTTNAKSSDNGEPLEAARAESTNYGYAVPVETIGSGQVIRHLVRFSQKGEFQLPSARYYAMYNAESRAYEDGRATRHKWNVR